MRCWTIECFKTNTLTKKEENTQVIPKEGGKRNSQSEDKGNRSLAGVLRGSKQFLQTGRGL